MLAEILQLRAHRKEQCSNAVCLIPNCRNLVMCYRVLGDDLYIGILFKRFCGVFCILTDSIVIYLLDVFLF